jgi:hypothetical protein
VISRFIDLLEDTQIELQNNIETLKKDAKYYHSLGRIDAAKLLVKEIIDIEKTVRFYLKVHPFSCIDLTNGIDRRI